MKKGYWVVAYRAVSDSAALQEYSKLAGAVVAGAGGKPIVRASEPVEVFEAGIKQRTVVIEFDSVEKALATYNSETYKAALKALGNAAERDFRIVEGVE